MVVEFEILKRSRSTYASRGQEGQLLGQDLVGGLVEAGHDRRTCIPET